MYFLHLHKHTVKYKKSQTTYLQPSQVKWYTPAEGEIGEGVSVSSSAPEKKSDGLSSAVPYWT